MVYEIDRAGYQAEGNEISYHQLLASSWIFNHAGKTPHSLYPFAAQFTNLRSRKQQLRKVLIPDVRLADGMNQVSADGEGFGHMTMTAGDFIISYGGKECKSTFDAVVTMFFVDTASNLIRYVETVSNCLKSHGVWINVGPLLWHCDAGLNTQRNDGHDGKTNVGDDDEDTGIGAQGTFELTEEEVIWLLEKKNFQIEHRSISSDGLGYIQDPDSLLQNVYRVSCWVVRKTG